MYATFQYDVKKYYTMAKFKFFACWLSYPLFHYKLPPKSLIRILRDRSSGRLYSFLLLAISSIIWFNKTGVKKPTGKKFETCQWFLTDGKFISDLLPRHSKHEQLACIFSHCFLIRRVLGSFIINFLINFAKSGLVQKKTFVMSFPL